MLNNHVLRSLRFTLNATEAQLAQIIKLGGGSTTESELVSYLKDDDEEGFVKCPQNALGRFLNGLIYHKRGQDDSRPPLQVDLPTNNVVLKKLRVAFQLKDTDLIAMLRQGNFDISKTELSAMFRAEGHPNYRPCGDQFLRQVLKALAARERNLNRI